MNGHAYLHCYIGLALPLVTFSLHLYFNSGVQVPGSVGGRRKGRGTPVGGWREGLELARRVFVNARSERERECLDVRQAVVSRYYGK